MQNFTTVFCLYLLAFPLLVLCEDKVLTFEVAKEYFGRISNYLQGNFFYAFQYCKSIGKNVPTPNTKDKSDALIHFLTENKIERAWTSGNDLSKEGTFIWMTDGSKVTYTKWGEPPDNYNGTEHCIQLLLRPNGNYYWNDAVCSKTYPIICEGENVNIPSTRLPQAIKCIDII